MAIAEYIVICDQESAGLQKGGLLKWNGSATGSEVTQVKVARYLVLNAESTSEAIKGVKQLYPGWIKTKCIAVAKESTEEA